MKSSFHVSFNYVICFLTIRQRIDNIFPSHYFVFTFYANRLRETTRKKKEDKICETKITNQRVEKLFLERERDEFGLGGAAAAFF